jgi:aryl-alcohol dehydrogenase
MTNRRGSGGIPSSPDRHGLMIRAAVLRSAGGPFSIEPVEMKGPRDDEIVVRLVSSGMCRTDVDMMKYSNGQPVVLGHEGAGVVEAVGKDVKEMGPGDHIVLSYQSCGTCTECLKGRPAHCRRFWDLNFGFARIDGGNAYEEMTSTPLCPICKDAKS